jgi:FkbM family methyltransferase
LGSAGSLDGGSAAPDIDAARPCRSGRRYGDPVDAESGRSPAEPDSSGSGLAQRFLGGDRAGRPHRVLDGLARQNERCLAEVAEFRKRLASGLATPRDHAVIKQQYPYFGVLPCRAGGIDFVLFHAHDDVVGWEYLWFGDDGYEPEIVETWTGWAREARLVYDVGGYTGLMSVLAALANRQSQVHLFEPMERTVERAQVNLRLNGVAENVHLHDVAASDAAGEATINLYRPEQFLGTGTSLYDKGLKIHGVKTVHRVALDDLLPDGSPDLVKIDVEGHELAALRGLERTIARGRPRMIVEIWEHTRTDVLQLLDAWGYESASFEREESRVMNFRCSARPSG